MESSVETPTVPFVVRKLPPIKSVVLRVWGKQQLAIDPVYCTQTKRTYLTLATVRDSTTSPETYNLQIYEYDPHSDDWSYFSITHHLPLFNATQTINSINRTLYIIATEMNADPSPPSRACTHSTILFTVDLNSGRSTSKIIDTKYKPTSLDNIGICHILCTQSMTKSQSQSMDLHLLYSEKMKHIRIQRDDIYECPGIEIPDDFNNWTRLRYAKCVHIPMASKLFVFGGSSPKYKRTHSEHSEFQKKERKIRGAMDLKVKSRKKKYGLQTDPRSIWYYDPNSNQNGDEGNGWCLYPQRLPRKTRNFGVMNAFGSLVFLFYYGDSNEIWILDLLTADMIRCSKMFPVRCRHRMRMCSTAENIGHFMMMHEDFAWTFSFSDKESDHRIMFRNQITGMQTTDDWSLDAIKASDYGKISDPFKECNFNISVDLMDFVPDMLCERYCNRFIILIKSVVGDLGETFPKELIPLLARFYSKLTSTYKLWEMIRLK